MTKQHGDIHIIGGGIAGLAAAVFAIRDGHVPGRKIYIYEEGRDKDSQHGANVLGGCLDSTLVINKGLVMRGGRMFEEAYRCTYDLLSGIPSLDDPNISARDDIFNFTKEASWNATARLVDSKGKILNVVSMGFDWGDRVALLRLLLAKENHLDNKKINDVLPEHFFKSNFWIMWCTMFSFQPWHSAMEMRRYLLRFIHLFSQIADLSCVYHTRYDQYHSMVVPIVKWLEQNGVNFTLGKSIVDLEFQAEDNGVRVIALECRDSSQDVQTMELIRLNREDVVLVTNGSMTDAATLGSSDQPAPYAPNNLSGAWLLWRKMTTKIQNIGNPNPFVNDPEATKWLSFTIVTKSPKFAEALFQLTGITYGREGLITFPDSKWFITIHPHFRPVFPGHGEEDGFVWWGYGLRPDAQGDFVKKRMVDCNGVELLEETLRHLRLDELTISEIKASSTSMPCLMPFVTSQFMPRRLGDRPAVRPEGIANLAFIGQFAEAEKDVVFTVEYSVRTAKMAIASFFQRPDGSPIEIPPMYRGYLVLSKLLTAAWVSIRPSWWPFA